MPYSIDNLHKMANDLGIKKCWYHTGEFPHYDIPLKKLEEVKSKCKIVSKREILRIILEKSNEIGYRPRLESESSC